jgi:hypothetical protein
VTFFVKGTVEMTENVTMGLQNRAEPEVDETGGFFFEKFLFMLPFAGTAK